MNKTDLIQEVARKNGITKTQAGKIVNTVLETMTEALNAGEKVQLTGFGAFEPRYRPARQGHNPKSLAPVEIPAMKSVSFRAGSGLKGTVEE